MILTLLLSLVAQPIMSRMPPAEPLPAPGLEEQAVMEPINALLAGIAARNPRLVEAQILIGGSATSVIVRADGTSLVQRRPWSEVVARFEPGAEKVEERLSDPAIESDGAVAMVWGNYVFLVDGKVHHCGIDHFNLVRQNGAWKISDVSWSERLTRCPGQ